jgi:hypothetical protein
LAKVARKKINGNDLPPANFWTYVVTSPKLAWHLMSPSLALFMAWAKSKPWVNMVAIVAASSNSVGGFPMELELFMPKLEPCYQLWNGFFHHTGNHHP